MMNRINNKSELLKFVDIGTVSQVPTNNKRVMYCMNPSCVKHTRTHTENTEGTKSINYIEVCLSDQTVKYIDSPCQKECGMNIATPINPRCPSCNSEKYLRFPEDSGVDEVEKLNFAKASLVEFKEDVMSDIHTLDPSEGFNEGYQYWEKPKLSVETERKIKTDTTQYIYDIIHPEPQDKSINLKLENDYRIKVHSSLSKQQVIKLYKNMNFRSSMMNKMKFESDKWYEHSYELERMKLAVISGNLTRGIVSIPKEYKDRNTETMTIEKILLNEIAPKKEFPVWEKMKEQIDIQQLNKIKIEQGLKKLRDMSNN